MTPESSHDFAASLSPKQRKALRGLAHSIKPCVQIGQNGLQESVRQHVAQALQDHELIKVQMVGQQTAAAGDKRALTHELEQALDAHCHVVSRIGRMVVVYLEKEPSKARLPLKGLTQADAQQQPEPRPQPRAPRSPSRGQGRRGN